MPYAHLKKKLLSKPSPKKPGDGRPPVVGVATDSDTAADHGYIEKREKKKNTDIA